MTPVSRSTSTTFPEDARRVFYRAAEEALALAEEEWPKPVRIARSRATPEQERRFADFKARRDKSAKEHNIEPSLIAPKGVLEALAADPEAMLPKVLPWQRALLGFEDV